jgi:hypothetical protein
MTAQTVPDMVVAISVTMQCAIPIGEQSATRGEVPGERDLAREAADAIGDACTASVWVAAGHITVVPASEPFGVARLSPAAAERVAPSTVLLHPISRADPSLVWLMAAHQPRRPDWCCATCGTPWPCAIRQADLTAAVYAGNGLGVGLTLTGNVAAAWLDQPGACPGCLTGQFFGWIDDDLYALIVAASAAPAAACCDGSTAHDGMADPAPDAEPRARPCRRPVRLAVHLPDCPAAPSEPDRIAPKAGLDSRQGGDSA